MKIKFKDLLDRPIPESNMRNIVEIAVKFCPLCGWKLTETEN